MTSIQCKQQGRALPWTQCGEWSAELNIKSQGVFTACENSSCHLPSNWRAGDVQGWGSSAICGLILYQFLITTATARASALIISHLGCCNNLLPASSTSVPSWTSAFKTSSQDSLWALSWLCHRAARELYRALPCWSGQTQAPWWLPEGPLEPCPAFFQFSLTSPLPFL